MLCRRWIPDVVVTILWGMAVLVLAWTWLPALIASLGGTKYLNGGTNDAENLEPTQNEPDYAFWVYQLTQLGYEPLGRGWVRIDFAAHEWSLYTVVRLFYHAENQCYAILQKVPAPFHFWPGVIFATCFADGRLLFTDNNEALFPLPDEEFFRQGVVSLNLAAVEELHLATMEALRRKGLRPESEANVETLFQAMKKHVGPRSASALWTRGYAISFRPFAYSCLGFDTRSLHHGAFALVGALDESHPGASARVWRKRPETAVCAHGAVGPCARNSKNS